jgi:AraC-like DNA-binding protein
MIGYKLTAEQGLAGIFGASLQPGTIHRISGKPAWLYTNNVVESTTFFSPPVISPFITRFRKTKDNRERLALLTEFYRQFNIADEYELFKEAIRLIYRHRGCISVKKICENLRINERYLQREFRAKLGVAPSNYLKVIRFNNIFTELSLAKERQNLETLALLYNYYDLSHFNKEYKNYFGLAPSKFLLHEFSLLKDLISETPYLLEVQKRNSF